MVGTARYNDKLQYNFPIRYSRELKCSPIHPVYMTDALRPHKPGYHLFKPTMARISYLAVWQILIANSRKSPLVASSTSSSTIRPYFSSYSALTLRRCCRSQCNLTRREMSSSTRCWRSCLLDVASREDRRLLEERPSFAGSMRSTRAWWRSMASLAGRLTGTRN